MARPHLPVTGVTSDGAAVAIAETDIGHLTQLAGWASFPAAAERLLAPLGLACPGDYRHAVRAGGATAWRIAPDRILLRTAARPGLTGADDIAVLDLSEARIGLSIAGAGAAGLLSRVVALDFSEAAFPAGSFVQTGLHHVGVLIERTDRDSFVVFIPTTWARSLTGLLADHLLGAA